MKYFIVLCLLATVLAVTMGDNLMAQDQAKTITDANTAKANLPLKRMQRAPRGGGVINGAQTQFGGRGGGGVLNGPQTQIGGRGGGGVLNGAQTQIGRTRG